MRRGVLIRNGTPARFIQEDGGAHPTFSESTPGAIGMERASSQAVSKAGR